MSKSLEQELDDALSVEEETAPVINIGQELRAKAFEALSWLINSVHQCKITEEQFNTGVDVLFMAVSGLVPEHTLTEEDVIKAAMAGRMPDARGPRFIDVITDCQKEIENVYPILKRVLFNHADGSFKVFQWQAGDSFVTCTTCVKGGSTATKSRLDFDSPVKAKTALDRVASPDALLKFGYVEVT
jgi:hypothetical protein